MPFIFFERYKIHFYWLLFKEDFLEGKKIPENITQKQKNHERIRKNEECI